MQSHASVVLTITGPEGQSCVDDDPLAYNRSLNGADRLAKGSTASPQDRELHSDESAGLLLEKRVQVGPRDRPVI
jgi:hypothetical protein